jgi:hypothetical protein
VSATPVSALPESATPESPASVGGSVESTTPVSSGDCPSAVATSGEASTSTPASISDRSKLTSSSQPMVIQTAITNAVISRKARLARL